MKNASNVTLFFLNISCDIYRKGSNLKLFFIMFEFIYLFVIIQKEQCRLIPSYNGLLPKPVFTKVFQLNLQKSP